MTNKVRIDIITNINCTDKLESRINSRQFLDVRADFYRHLKWGCKAYPVFTVKKVSKINDVDVRDVRDPVGFCWKEFRYVLGHFLIPKPLFLVFLAFATCRVVSVVMQS